MRNLRLAFFGSSLVSAYWNGAATYYRGILRALAGRGWDVTFFEPDAYDRQQHVDHPDHPYAIDDVYANSEAGWRGAIEQAKGFDVIVKASGVGVFDRELEAAVADLRRPGNAVVFWDVDAPATLDRTFADEGDPFRPLVPRYDAILTYGGGPPVVAAYEKLGAKRCVPIYNAADLDTHRPAPAIDRYRCDLALLANRLPDREERINRFFLDAARAAPDRRFLLGGSGWHDADLPPNVGAIGHVPTPEHNSFNCTPLAVLNVNRESMARYGWSPATRVFEAAAAGACLITDAWQGIDDFLEPGEEILVAEDGEAVARHLMTLTEQRAAAIGTAARLRVEREHTYARRGELADEVLRSLIGR